MSVIRYGIVGASGIAQRRVLPAFPHIQHSSATAICSRSLDKARALAAEFEIENACDSLDELLKHVDAVYVATPVHCHLAEARQVLSAGKHLLIEKPLGRTAQEGRDILALAESSSVYAMEAYMMKFHPAHAAIHDAVLSGKIGRIVYARARLGCWYPDLAGSWRQDRQLSGGGALMDLGSHLIDLLTWIVGPIDSLQAHCNTQLFNYEVEDSATAILHFANGAHGIIESYFSVPDQAGSGVLELIGTEGRIVAEGTVGQSGAGTVTWNVFPTQATYDALQEKTPSAEHQSVVYPPFDLYAAQLDYFSNCILQKTPPALNRLDEGVAVLEWIEKAYAAPVSL